MNTSVTPALRQLHWLPVRQSIQYKLASLAFRAAGDCQLVADSGRRSLRSAERRVCSVPRQNSTFGDRSFAAARPRAWNELPFSLRDTGLSLTTFNAHLKTYYFLQCLRPRRICDIYDFFAPYKCTYLLTYLTTAVAATFSLQKLEHQTTHRTSKTLDLKT